MRKTLIVTVAVLILHAVAWAQRLPPSIEYRENLGTVKSDTLRWRASGSVPGSGGQGVDTLIQTAVDTTAPIETGGAASVLLEILTRPVGSDSVNVRYIFQVASSSDTTAMWHTLSEDSTAATYNAIPATNTRDTMAVILASPYFVEPCIDTSAALARATAQTGVTTPAFANRVLVNSMRYTRVIAVQAAGSGDTNLATIVATRKYKE